MGVNICHLVNVRCCRDCDKNVAPKHGGVEFRLFDVAYGIRLRAILTILERMVQMFCAVHSSEELKPLLLLKGDKPSSDLSPLLKFLHLNATEVTQAFSVGD